MLQRNQRRLKNRHKQTKKENLIMLEQTVKDVQASLANNTTNGNHADNTAAEVTALLSQIDDLKLKLAAALEQGAMDALKAMRLVTVEAQRDALQQQLDTLTAAQPMPVAATAKIECSIQVDVKAPELTRWLNAGWQVQHYQFVSNGTSSVPALAVVMERPAEIKPELFRRDEESSTPEAPAPSNFAATQKVEVVFADELDEIVSEEEPVIVPEFVPSMDVPIVVPVLAPALATRPDFAKALRNPNATVDDVIAVGNEAILNAGRAVYNALQPTIEKYVEQPIEVIHG